MVQLYLITEIVHHRLQRLDAVSCPYVIVQEGVKREIDHLRDGRDQDIELRIARRREFHVFLCLGPCALGYIHRVVAHTLEVVNGMQIFADILSLGFCKIAGRDLHEISPELVLVAVYSIFNLFHLIVTGIGVIPKKHERIGEIFVCFSRHGVNGEPALFDRKGRMVEKPLFKPVEVCGHSLLSGAWLYNSPEKIAEPVRKRGKGHGADRPEDRVEERDRKSGHCKRHDPEMLCRVESIEKASYDCGGDRFNEQI